MNTNRLYLGQGFKVRWVLVSAIGLMVGFFIYFMSVVDLTAEQGFMLRTLASVLSGAAFGTAVGGVQLFVLQNEVSGMNRWIGANLVGRALGRGLGESIHNILVGGGENLQHRLLLGRTRSFCFSAVMARSSLGFSSGYFITIQSMKGTET